MNSKGHDIMVARMVKIAIVENNKIMANKIKKIIVKVLKSLEIKEDEYQLDLYYDGETALASETEYNISFLDVDLGAGIDGFEVGREMNTTYKIKPLLIVLTNFTDRGEDSSDIRAYWYLTKTSLEEKLHDIAAGAIKEVIPTEGEFIKVKGQEIFIYFKHIRFIQRLGGGIFIYTIDSVFATYKARVLDDWKNILPKGQFITAHKSNIVNLEYVKKISKNGISMNYSRPSEEVKVATQRIAKIEQAYDDYLLAKARRRL